MAPCGDDGGPGSKRCEQTEPQVAAEVSRIHRTGMRSRWQHHFTSDRRRGFNRVHAFARSSFSLSSTRLPAGQNPTPNIHRKRNSLQGVSVFLPPVSLEQCRRSNTCTYFPAPSLRDKLHQHVPRWPFFFCFAEHGDQGRKR